MLIAKLNETNEKLIESMLNGLEVARKFNMRIKPIDEFSLQILKAKQWQKIDKTLHLGILQNPNLFSARQIKYDQSLLHKFYNLLNDHFNEKVDQGNLISKEEIGLMNIQGSDVTNDKKLSNTQHLYLNQNNKRALTHCTQATSRLKHYYQNTIENATTCPSVDDSFRAYQIPKKDMYILVSTDQATGEQSVNMET